jgi:hypothetical protein
MPILSIRASRVNDADGSTPVARVLAQLDGVQRTGSGWMARCPAHNDRCASLAVAQGHDDRVLLCCHAGCTVSMIVAALGITLRDLFPARPAWRRRHG